MAENKRLIYDFETGGRTGPTAMPLQLGTLEGNVMFDPSMYFKFTGGKKSYVQEWYKDPKKAKKLLFDNETFFGTEEAKQASEITGINYQTGKKLDEYTEHKITSGEDMMKYLKSTFKGKQRIGFNSDQFDVVVLAKAVATAKVHSILEDPTYKDVKKQKADALEAENMFKKLNKNNKSTPTIAAEYVKKELGGSDKDVFTAFSRLFYGRDRPNPGANKSGFNKLVNLHELLITDSKIDRSGAHVADVDVKMTDELLDLVEGIQERHTAGTLTERDEEIMGMKEFKTLRANLEKETGRVKRLKAGAEAGATEETKKVKKLIRKSMGTGAKSGLAVAGIGIGVAAGFFAIDNVKKRQFDEQQIKMKEMDDQVNGNEGTYLQY